MFKSFKIVDDFIKDIYGCPLLGERMHPKIKATKIAELKNACNPMMDITSARRKPSPVEFMRHVYPLLEIAVHWSALKQEGKLTEDFCKHAVDGMQHIDNFYGTIFELDMASRCLLSGWPIRFVEYPKPKKGKQIDFIFFKKEKAVGVECLSKRFTAILTLKKIQGGIDDHAKKFRPEHIAKLGLVLDERVVVMDITRSDYHSPNKLLANLGKARVPNDLDAVVFTWREDQFEGDNHSLRAKYQTVGDAAQGYFSTTYAAEFLGGAFFMRKYVEPEPAWGAWGPEENVEDYNQKNQ